jgi:phospholipid/cholesterol/gamma-HCH transport system substrate-binding protein
MVVLAIAVVVALASQATALFGVRRNFTAELPDAAGIRSGDQVQLAGIRVGKVTGIAARGDRVHVDFRLDEDVPLTEDTRTEVKLATLLGTRFLDLTPGVGKPLESGDTIALSRAFGSYTLERFWLENGDSVGRFDLDALSSAVDVLATDLNGSPDANRAALDGLAGLAETVTRRDAQLTRLLTATRSVTGEAVAQRDQLVQLMQRGDQVFEMVQARKQAIDALLRDSRALVVDLTAIARRTHKPMTATLHRLRSILAVLVKHRDDLARTLEVADPALRLYVNSAGDGPWLGVNAPYFILPDSLWCSVRKDIGC